MIRLKLDSVHTNLVLANADLGGLAFAYQEKLEDMDCDISESVFRVTRKIEDQGEENGFVELKDSEMVTLLLAIRSAFETLMCNNPKVIRRVLANGDSRFSEIPIMSDLTHAARNAHVVLDFLECNAPKKVLNMWIEERKDSAHRMLDEITERFNDGPV